MNHFTVSTRDRSQFVNITSEVQKAATDQGIDRGAVTVFVPHTTAGITINENADPDVVLDIQKTLEKIVPWRGGYRHCEGNSAAHVKAGLMGSSVCVPVEGGKLALGTWQSIYFCEFDGPRQRKVWVS